MHLLDWIVLAGTLIFIVSYGVWKTRRVSSMESYLLGDRELKWWTIGLSIMATQASAITFLSTPGQAYMDGMRFAQFYIGLPIAMVVLSVVVIPIYYKLKVYTAYEYLESRFDLKTRSLTAFLFLVQRGLAAGLTIYAPAIILSSILDWPLFFTNLTIGFLVIIYTVSGGTNAVSQTQKQQMMVILGGMVVASIILISKLPSDVGFGEAVSVAGKMGKLNVIDFKFDLNNRYNFWSGILGGTFLFVSYFGTDQSQVQRYLSGKSLTESRLGLLFNGIFKVPMQFLVLFVGILVFVFFQFNQPPVHFIQENTEALEQSIYQDQYAELKEQDDLVFDQKQEAIRGLISSINEGTDSEIDQASQKVVALIDEQNEIREEVKGLIKLQNPNAEVSDDDYVFLSFVTTYLPIGLVGLLIAVIFSAAMSSTSSELNALATTSIVDFYKRSFRKDESDNHYLVASKLFTVLWGILALAFATFATLFDNLIEAVNIIGSIFYGTILGVFLTAFFLKYVRSNAIFIGAVIAEICVISIWLLTYTGKLNIAYLWLNAIGCLLTMFIASALQFVLPKAMTKEK